MNKYDKALFSLISLLGGGLRKEYLDNPKIKENLEMLKELTEEYKKLVDEKTKREWKEWCLKDE